ncbi:MAG: CDP-alcohol phosphatidyltransferase family protein [Hyphomicrobiales bacterium]|nr:CDP-alcohol phosphatidyltransferase family protein [Hyphomicrobiales bacterium]MDE2016902.1 CDP-alcohol phosphatidyltransferase family protein [Hyphomicrobiales bacterium]
MRGLPNLITIGRLALVPLVIALIADGRWGWAFAAFLSAGVSDAIDGFLARRFDARSELGAYLDPIADKALLMSVFVTLGVVNVIASSLAILVVSRDLMILGAVVVAWLLDKRMEIKPHLVSKLNTTAQIAFCAAVLGMRALGRHFGAVETAAAYGVAALTLASAAVYLALWLRHMAE